MQNSNEEDFKKKYLKYKAKYLELKDLLEGGIPPKTDQKEYPLLAKLETLCNDQKKKINVPKYQKIIV